MEHGSEVQLSIGRRWTIFDCLGTKSQQNTLKRYISFFNQKLNHQKAFKSLPCRVYATCSGLLIKTEH